MSTHLPVGHNFDDRSEQLPQAPVVANGIIDANLNDRRRARRAKGAKLFFPGTALTGPDTNEAAMVYKGEFAFTMRDTALLGLGGRFPGPPTSTLQRTVGNQENRIPVHSNVTGEAGDNEHEIQQRISVMGLVDQPPDRTTDRGLTLRLGGCFTVFNNSGYYIPQGALVRAKVPSHAEAKEIKAQSGRSFNTLGVNGRIPLIHAPYDPLKNDYYYKPAVQRAIDRIYERNADGTAWTEKKAFKDTGLASLTDEFARRVKAIIDAMVLSAGIGSGTPNVADLDTARSRIVEFLRFEDDAGASYDKRPSGGFPGLPHQRQADGSVVLVAKNQRHGPVNEALKNNLWQQVIAALGSFKLMVDEQVVGRAVFGAVSGTNYDLHMRSFAH